MKNLKVEVTRTDEYEIEIDESQWTPEALKDWSGTFYDVETVEELAEILASAITRNGYENFIEGFGYIKVFQNDEQLVQRDSSFNPIPEDEYCKGVKVTLMNYDDYYSANSETI